MFLKKSQFTKSGRTYSYYKIVETYKDGAGCHKHRVVKHLGKLSDEEAANIRQVLKEQRKRLNGIQNRAIRSEADDPAYLQRNAQIAVLLETKMLAYEPYAQKEWNVTEADMLLLVREGTGELYMDGKKIELRYGLVVYAPAGSGMHVVNTSGSVLQLDRMTIEAVSRTGSPAAGGTYRSERFSAIVPEPKRLHSPYRALQLFKELHEGGDSRDPRNSIKRQLLFYTLLDIIACSRLEANPSDSDPTDVIEQAVEMIHESYGDDLTRDQLAEQLGVSPEHFSRLFKKEKGMSFIEYLLQFRIEKSRELLLLSKSSVNEVAGRVGFQNPYYFSRKFKQLVGVSPSAYIHQAKKYVTLYAGLTSCLLTLGVIPRAGILTDWMASHYKSLLDKHDFLPIEGLDDRSFQMISELNPDLVFCNVHKMDLAKVVQLGPVAAIDMEKIGWREQLRYMAEVVGKQKEAEDWLRSFEQRLTEAKKKLSGILNGQDTFAIMKVVSGKMYIYGDLRSMGGPMLYRELQLPPPAAVKERIIDQGLLNVCVTPAELGDYSADHLFLMNYESNWTDNVKSFKAHPNWKKFSAVVKNQVYEVNPELFYGFDPLSLEMQMQEILKRVLPGPGHNRSL
ncbi:helix-turn-helix domain-containing protein [Paenibacillus ginsengarvi]|uniref:AraC family transcriptional regulator n=1 Tax=Paenibacillus ginsengarvi TaxID=400777 RepID=A0A3B0C7C9_9BACL|nr:AraC family transcriptional regulator [Paenibacillus ginsengarvi]RKN81942.1 AraC family transcriptional regulator [Paenibacillus ginsengarvi]